MNPFFSKQESRVRAWIRIPVFIILFFVIMAFSAAIPLMGFQYLITALTTFGFFWLMFRLTDNRSSISQAGLTVSPLWWKEYAIGSVIGAAAMGIIFAVELLNDGLMIDGYGWESSNWILPIAGLFVQMLCVGLYEEFMSRSYLLTNFKEGFTVGNIDPAVATVLAIAASSSIFGLLHFFNPNFNLFAFINIIGAGVMLAIPYVLTGRLAYSAGLHFAWNFFQGGVFGFHVSGMSFKSSVFVIHQTGNELWTGGSFGPEGGLIGTLAIVAICVIFVLIHQKQTGTIAFHSMFTNTYLQNEEKNKDLT